jgi:hypothetical protein
MQAVVAVPPIMLVQVVQADSAAAVKAETALPEHRAVVFKDLQTLGVVVAVAVIQILQKQIMLVDQGSL